MAPIVFQYLRMERLLDVLDTRERESEGFALLACVAEEEIFN